MSIVLILVLIVVALLFVAIGIMPLILSSIISKEDETSSPWPEARK